jgi:hypothetical protein
LKLRDNPTVHGRLGLLAASSDVPAVAANSLLRAMEGNGGADDAERNAFLQAFLRVRLKVCQVRIRGSVYDAEVAIDGSISGKDTGSAFKVFVLPGKHTARGTSPTAGTANEVFDCPTGGTAEVYLKWKRIGSPPVDPPERLLRKKNPMASSDEPGPEDESEKKPPIVGGVQSDQKKTGMRGSVGVGPVVVFGVASWAPAVGVAVSGSLQPMEYLSIDLDGRAAWLTSGVGGESIQAMTAGGILSLCGHWRWLFGCASAHLGVLKVDFPKERYQGGPDVFVKPGIGGRIGARFDLRGPFALQIAADVLGLSSATLIFVEDSLLVDQPAVLIGANVAGVWKF